MAVRSASAATCRKATPVHRSATQSWKPSSVTVWRTPKATGTRRRCSIACATCARWSESASADPVLNALDVAQWVGPNRVHVEQRDACLFVGGNAVAHPALRPNQRQVIQQLLRH